MQDQWVTTEFPTGKGPPSPVKKETAARTNRTGGARKKHDETRNDSREPARRASLKLSPIWNDDGYFQGWISLGEAAALALLHLRGRP
jgi:hypothetical protein